MKKAVQNTYLILVALLVELACTKPAPEPPAGSPAKAVVRTKAKTL